MKRIMLSNWIPLLFLVALIATAGFSQGRRDYTEQRAEMERRKQAFFKERDEARKHMRAQMERRARIPKGELAKLALDVTEAQWRKIRPRLSKVRGLLAESRVGIGIFAGGGGGGGGGGGSSSSRSSQGGGPTPDRGRGGASGGSFGINGQPQDALRSGKLGGVEVAWGWSRPSARRGPLTEGQKVCGALLDLIESDEPDSMALERKVAALQKIRGEAKDALPTAQAELRAALNERQQAILVLMGYL